MTGNAHKPPAYHFDTDPLPLGDYSHVPATDWAAADAFVASLADQDDELAREDWERRLRQGFALIGQPVPLDQWTQTFGRAVRDYTRAVGR